jgi:hypothetical protein
MKIRQLYDNPSGTYTYLVWDETSREAAIIDSVREQLERDIQLIRELDLNCSTIGEEKRFNPRLGGGRSREEYIRITQSMELEKPRLIDVAVPDNQACGLVRQG